MGKRPVWILFSKSWVCVAMYKLPAMRHEVVVEKSVETGVPGKSRVTDVDKPGEQNSNLG